MYFTYRVPRDVVLVIVAGCHKETIVKREALKARVLAFMKEFPFVERYVQPHWLSSRPSVQRVDLDLLDEVGHTKVYAWGGGGIFENPKRYILLTTTGKELLVAKRRDVVRRRFSLVRPSTWLKKRIEGESVGEAIQRLRDIDAVGYVLKIEDPFARDEQSRDKTENHEHGGASMVLYKAPQGLAFSIWLMKIREIAAEELQADLSKVDTL